MQDAKETFLILPLVWLPFLFYSPFLPCTLKNTGLDQNLARVSSNTSGYSTIVPGGIHMWDMFLLLTLASCLWQFNWVSIILGEDYSDFKII